MPDPVDCAHAGIVTRERSRETGRARMTIAHKTMDTMHDAVLPVVERVMRRLMTGVTGISSFSCTSGCRTVPEMDACTACTALASLHIEGKQGLRTTLGCADPTVRGEDLETFMRVFTPKPGVAPPYSTFDTDTYNLCNKLLTTCLVWRMPRLKYDAAWTTTTPTAEFVAVQAKLLLFAPVRHRYFGHAGTHALSSGELEDVLLGCTEVLRAILALTAPEGADQPATERHNLNGAVRYIDVTLRAEADALPSADEAVAAPLAPSHPLLAMVTKVRDETDSLRSWYMTTTALGDTDEDLKEIRDEHNKFRVACENAIATMEGHPEGATVSGEIVEHLVSLSDFLNSLHPTSGAMRGGAGSGDGGASYLPAWAPADCAVHTAPHEVKREFAESASALENFFEELRGFVAEIAPTGAAEK